MRLADYIVTDGLRMVLTFTLEELLYELRNVNPNQSKPMLEKGHDDEEEGGEEEAAPPPPEGGEEGEAPEETMEEPIVDLVPAIQYFVVELHIREEILTFDPSYQTYASKVIIVLCFLIITVLMFQVLF